MIQKVVVLRSEGNPRAFGQLETLRQGTNT
jgi:hypothetical protein